MPFMIITFRVILLYYTELYPDEKESSAVPSASVADVNQAQTWAYIMKTTILWPLKPNIDTKTFNQITL